MATDTNLNQLVINKLTRAQYEAAKNAGQTVNTELYMITDDESITVDSTVIAGSSNPVSGNAVYSAINAIPTPDVSGQISAHNTSSSAHSDIRTAVSNAATAAANAQTAANSKAPMYTYGTEDLTAGSSPLATGVLHFVYE